MQEPAVLRALSQALLGLPFVGNQPSQQSTVFQSPGCSRSQRTLPLLVTGAESQRRGHLATVPKVDGARTDIPHSCLGFLTPHRATFSRCLAGDRPRRKPPGCPHHSPCGECTWYVSRARPRPAATRRLPRPVCTWG